MTRARQLATQRRSQRKILARRREWLANLKNKPCADCGKKYPPYVMDFDHVRGQKKFTIGPAWSRSQVALLQEIAKCDLVCSNCHRERTWRRNHSR